jgi:hypothetical protein
LCASSRNSASRRCSADGPLRFIAKSRGLVDGVDQPTPRRVSPVRRSGAHRVSATIAVRTPNGPAPKRK